MGVKYMVVPVDRWWILIWDIQSARWHIFQWCFPYYSIQTRRRASDVLSRQRHTAARLRCCQIFAWIWLSSPPCDLAIPCTRLPLEIIKKDLECSLLLLIQYIRSYPLYLEDVFSIRILKTRHAMVSVYSMWQKELRFVKTVCRVSQKRK
jgi:hypothetical protein